MKCPRCEAENREGARFCRECGALFAAVCSSCGARMEATGKFCDNCEALLAAIPVLTLETPHPVRAEVPTAEDVTDIVRASKGPADAERRQLTVMFCDLVGSTALSERLDPEEFRDVVRAYQEICAEVITRFDGHLAKYLGDGLLVYFGYPRAHEDDSARAVRAGLGMVEELERLNARLEKHQGVRLAMRVGIHTGLVVAGKMGTGEQRESQGIIGETPNIAARLQEAAAPDTVIVSAATHRLPPEGIGHGD